MLKSIFLAALFLFSFCCYSQSPGQIVRPAVAPFSAKLDVNQDGYVSKTTAGFVSNDIAESELPYIVVPPVIVEPTGDLATGPSGGFTDIVQTVDGSGFYVYSDGTNLYFRLRVGGIISGSKGYSILIDEDNKMGNSGPYADPNYVAPTNTSNGNPGFEYEVELQTNFQVAVYNVDGIINPSSPTTYSLSTNSQISMALSTDGNNPDYFYDWYVPLSAIGNPSSIRLVATTVTSPTSALQGSRSDIYGINDANYSNVASAWTTLANSEPTINITGSGISTVSPTCTAAPSLSSPITIGSNVSVGGTWTSLDASKPQTATITLYKNGSALGTTTTVNSGGTWSITVPTIASGDVFYAKALATGESQCLQSNVVTAGCTSTPSTPVLTCASTKGIGGTIDAGNTVTVYLVPTTTASPTSNPIGAGTITYPSSTQFQLNNCSGGSSTLSTGTYMVIASNGSCSSLPRFECISSGSSSTVGLTANSSISVPTLYPFQNTINGTGSVSGDIMRLFINGTYINTIQATGASFSFTNVTLQAGDQIKIYNQSGTNCATVASFTVSCYNAPPIISADASNTILSSATSISGTAAAGASITLNRTSPTTASWTTTANSSGAWSVTGLTLTAGDKYTATVSSTSACSQASQASAAVTVATATSCPSISFGGSYTNRSTSVAVTMSSFSGVLRLYIDGYLIGSSGSLSSATAYSFSVAANTLYYGGVLTVTAQGSGSNAAESSACATQTIGCSSPNQPTVSPASSTITTGQSVAYTISTLSSGAWYSIRDNTGKSYATAVYNSSGSSLGVTTNTFSSAGTYNLVISADDGSGCPASTRAALVTVNSATLPVHFLNVRAKDVINETLITWTVADEQNVSYYEVEKSVDGSYFQSISRVAYQPASASTHQYSYTESDPLNSGKRYYRIKQVDRNGFYTYSVIVNISRRPVESLQLVPNPAKENVTLKLYSNEEKTVKIELLDMGGRVLLTRLVTVRAGDNTIGIENLKSYGKGTVLVKVIAGDKNFYQKLVIL